MQLACHPLSLALHALALLLPTHAPPSPGICPKMPRTSGSENHFVNPGMSDMRDTQKDPSGALLTPSGVPGSLSIKTSLLPARGCGGRYSLRSTTESAFSSAAPDRPNLEAVCLSDITCTPNTTGRVCHRSAINAELEPFVLSANAVQCSLSHYMASPCCMHRTGVAHSCKVISEVDALAVIIGSSPLAM